MSKDLITCIKRIYSEMVDTTMIRIRKKTARSLRKVCGKLQGEDGFHTSYDSAIEELIRFWDEYKHLEEG